MKKYFFGVFALVFAIGLSAYTRHNTVTKSSESTTYWFYVSDSEPAGTSSSPSIAPAGVCSASGSGCIEGFESATPLTEKPNTEPNGRFAHN